jgi:predicted CXXCH cytochrome family protein
MEDTPSMTDTVICSKCGYPVTSEKNSLTGEGETTLCSQCYRLMLVPGHKSVQMENLD